MLSYWLLIRIMILQLFQLNFIISLYYHEILTTQIPVNTMGGRFVIPKINLKVIYIVFIFQKIMNMI